MTGLPLYHQRISVWPDGNEAGGMFRLSLTKLSKSFPKILFVICKRIIKQNLDFEVIPELQVTDRSLEVGTFRKFQIVGRPVSNTVHL